MTNKALVEALRPFAKALDEWGDDTGQPDRWTVWEHPIAMDVTLGDFRRAKAALASSGNEAPGDDKGLVEAEGGWREAFQSVLTSHRVGMLDGWELDLLRRRVESALSSGNEVAKVVGWLRAEATQYQSPIPAMTLTRAADAIERGDHLASDTAPLTGGGGNG